MRKLELIRALLGLEQAHAVIVEDRHRLSVVVFESPVDRRLAIGDGYFIAYCLRHPRSFRRRSSPPDLPLGPLTLATKYYYY